MQETIDKLFSIIHRVSFTRADMLRRIRMVREYLEYKYFSSRASTELADYLRDNQVSGYDSQALIAFGDAFYANFSRETAYTVIDGLVDKVKQYPVVTLYIPFEPTADDITKIGTWFRDEVDNTILLDLHVDSNLIGGCAFAYRGVYKDYTLRYYLTKRHEEIGAMLDQMADAIPASSLGSTGA
jgi:hypothetical protein